MHVMRYLAERDGEEIGFIPYLDSWLEPQLTPDRRGIFDVDDIWTAHDRARFTRMIDEAEEIRPSGTMGYADDVEEAVFRRGTQAHRFEAFTRKLMTEVFTLRPAPIYDDAC